jgi:hypothetical protein
MASLANAMMFADAVEGLAKIAMFVLASWLLCTVLTIGTFFMKRANFAWFAVAMLSTCLGGFATFSFLLLWTVVGIGPTDQSMLIAGGFSAVPFILGLVSLLKLNRCRRPSPDGNSRL